MKYLIVVFIILFIISCDKEKECDNPQYCFTGPSALRITYFDDNGQNMFDSNYQNAIEISDVVSASLGQIEFNVSSVIGGTIETGFSHMHISKDAVRDDCEGFTLDCVVCINEECELYITYNNRPEVDTLNVLYEKVTEYDENNCPCTSYPLMFIKNNGSSIREDLGEHGTFIIRK